MFRKISSVNHSHLMSRFSKNKTVTTIDNENIQNIHDSQVNVLTFQKFIPFHVALTRTPKVSKRVFNNKNDSILYTDYSDNFNEVLEIYLKTARHDQAANLIRHVFVGILPVDERTFECIKCFLISALQNQLTSAVERYMDILIYLIDEVQDENVKQTLITVFENSLNEVLLKSGSPKDIILRIDDNLCNYKSSSHLRQYFNSKVAMKAIKLNHFHVFYFLKLSHLSVDVGSEAINILMKNDRMSSAIDVAKYCEGIREKIILHLHTKVVNIKEDQYLSKDKIIDFNSWMKNKGFNVVQNKYRAKQKSSSDYWNEIEDV